MSGIAKILRFFGIVKVICYCIMACLAADCNTPGWFGERCQYKCRCDPADSCGKDGSCSKCEKWWFGPACQYADLMKLGQISTVSAKAGDSICESYKDWIHIKWNNPIYLTWLRLKYSEDIQDKNDIKVRLSEKLIISYYDENGLMVSVNHRSALVDSKTMDIYCYLNLAVTQVNISGPQLTSLCTVQISGGRNIALKQETQQSTTKDPYKSNLAVDGNANSYFSEGNTCTHTGDPDHWPYLSVNFPTSFSIYQYVLYNRYDYRERLRGFTMEAHNEGGHNVFGYEDKEEIPHLIYNITSDSIKTVIKRVIIRPEIIQGKNDYNRILTLCELEIFGDRECSSGKYGRDCENPCNCAVKGENCFFSTGICPSGCPPGYHQDGCQKRCDRGKYGINCLQTCDYRCLGDECDKEDGRCVKGCKAGYLGPRCNIACKNRTYGMNCTSVCPLNCNEEPCDVVKGLCYACKNGYTGDDCDKEVKSTVHVSA